MRATSFLSEEELGGVGFRALGRNVLVSRFARIYAPEKIEIGDHSRIDDFAVLSGGQGIAVGRYVHLGAASQIFGGGGVAIGDFAALSGRVALYSQSDDFHGGGLNNPTVPERFRDPAPVAPVSLGRHVLIGTASTILPGVSIGEGCAVGAHSLVKASCEPWMIYHGVPAKPTKPRRRNLLEAEARLLEWERAATPPRSSEP